MSAAWKPLGNSVDVDIFSHFWITDIRKKHTSASEIHYATEENKQLQLKNLDWDETEAFLARTKR